MKKIKLINLDDYVLIDNEDYKLLSQFKWKIDKQGYVIPVSVFCENFKLKSNKLHRHLMNPPSKMAVDHINHNKLDNRKSNLRVCTLAQNSANKPRKPGGSYNIRESKSTGHFYINFSCQNYGKVIHLSGGPYENKETAITEWNKLALQHRGEYANLM